MCKFVHKITNLVNRVSNNLFFFLFFFRSREVIMGTGTITSFLLFFKVGDYMFPDLQNGRQKVKLER